MNYNWKTITSKNNETGNYYGIFDIIISNINVRIYISVSPKISESNNKRFCFSHIYFETSEEKITKLLFHEVSEEIYHILSKNIDNISNIFKIAMIEYYCVDKIPSCVAFTSGDYFFDSLE